MQDEFEIVPPDTRGVKDARGTDRGTCFCRRCGRKLKTVKAKEKGMGEVCFRKFQKEQHMTPLIQIGK